MNPLERRLLRLEHNMPRGSSKGYKRVITPLEDAPQSEWDAHRKEVAALQDARFDLIVRQILSPPKYEHA